MKRVTSLLKPYALFNLDVPPAIRALAAFAARNPGFEFANYGDASAYRSDARRATRSLHDVADRLRDCALAGVDDGDVFAAAPTAFSGRITLTRIDDDTVEVDYCTGQYWPTEYRAAVAAVLDQAVRMRRRRSAAQSEEATQ